MRTNEQTAFTRLLEDYCRSVGMGDFEIDPEGGEFEVGDVLVSVRHDEDFCRLSMTATVANMPQEQTEQLAPILLQLNAALGANGGMAFSAEMESGVVLLQQSAPLKNVDPEDVDSALAELVGKCRSARELFATMGEGSTMISELMEKAMQGHSSEFVTFRL